MRGFDARADPQVFTRGITAAFYLMLLCVIFLLSYMASKQHRPSSKAMLRACIGGALSGGAYSLSKASLAMLKCAALASTCEDEPLKVSAHTRGWLGVGSTRRLRLRLRHIGM